MRLIFYIGFIIFILYIINQFEHKTTETFKNKNTSLVSNELYKENTDLNYMNKRISNNITKKQNIKTNRLSPINNISLGVEPYKPENIKVRVNNVPSNRVPGPKSTKNYYNIPLPNFDKNIDNKIINREKKNKKIKLKKIKNKTYTKPELCKFVFSYSNEKFNCPKNYPVYTGANLSVKGSAISCNGSEQKIKNAKAVASINNGSLHKIYISNKGSGYTSKPNIKIKGGGGTGASAYATTKNGQIKNIIVTNSGKSRNEFKTGSDELGTSMGRVREGSGKIKVIEFVTDNRRTRRVQMA